MHVYGRFNDVELCFLSKQQLYTRTKYDKPQESIKKMPVEKNEKTVVLSLESGATVEI